MEILTLGSGTSHGVPMIGCECEVCRSTNPRNKRFRPSILVTTGQGTILVDATPEMRMQMLAFDVKQVDALLITHTHADHIMGFDDIRRFNDMTGREMPVYGSPNVLADIQRVFDYIFRQTQAGGGKPRVELHDLAPIIDLIGLKIRPLTVMHGKLPITAYRFDEPSTGTSFAYVTDTSEIPAEAMEHLYGLDLLTIDSVRFEPHPTHFGLYQALEVIEQVKPKRALITHISHHFEHDGVNAQLPDHVRLSYDGLRIRLGAGSEQEGDVVVGSVGDFAGA